MSTLAQRERRAAPALWRTVFALALAALAALAGGCREGYLPYYDAAPEAWKVAYDDRHAERILARRRLLDRIADHPRDYPTILQLAAEEWSSGRQQEAIQVLDYMLGQLNPQDPSAPDSPTARVALVLKVRYYALMAYDAARFEAGRGLLARFAPADADGEYNYVAGLLAERTAAHAVDPLARTQARLQALTYLDRALEKDPQQVEALQLRARLAFEDGQWDEVIGLCQRWSAVMPADGRAWYTQGVARERKQDFAGAITLFEKAVQLEPDQPDPWYGLAVAEMAGGDAASAEHALREVIRLKPTHAQAYYKLYLIGSSAPLTAERYELLVRAATLARRDPAIQQALIDVTRTDRPNRGDLLLFGLQNLMNLELENGDRLNAAPILAYAEEAVRQERFEEAFFALANPLMRNPTFETAHPEWGLRLLRLATHWIDPVTGRWNPPPVQLLDPTRPLAAENIGRPVLYKSILDSALYTGRFMFLADTWKDYSRYGLDASGPPQGLGLGAQSLADQLPPADREELLLLVARINVARIEHLRRILFWHTVLSPIVPFNLKIALPDGADGSRRPAYPVASLPDWWLQPTWDAFRQVKVSELVTLDDTAYSRAVSSLAALRPLLIEELRTGLARDNYGGLDEEPRGGPDSDQNELDSAYADGLFALDLLTKQDDPLHAGDSPEAQARHREWLYLQLQLAPLLPVSRGNDARLARVLRSINQAVTASAALVAAEPSAARQAALRPARWYWLMRMGDQAALREELGAPAAGSAALTDPYACGVRLWLRAIYLRRGQPAAVSPAGRGDGAATGPAAGAVQVPLREDLERMLDGLSSYETVPALRLRMEISTAAGLAFGDDELAASAAENLARIEASTENGQETQVLNLLAMIYEKEQRWLPAIYCLRRSIPRIDARNEANASLQQGWNVGRFSSPESVRLLRWRLLNLWKRLGNDRLAREQLLEIAGYGPDGLPVGEALHDKSAARAAALFALAAERMATGKLSDCRALCNEAYACFESPNDTIEQYRLTASLIALATVPTENLTRLRENIQRDQLEAAAFLADGARVLEAFDSALQGKTSLLLETPEVAANYLRPTQDALELALAVQAARKGDEAGAQAHLAKAQKSPCAGVAGMTRAVGYLCAALAAKARGETGETAAEQWLAQGGRADCLKAGAPSPAPGPAPEKADPANPPIGN